MSNDSTEERSNEPISLLTCTMSELGAIGRVANLVFVEPDQRVRFLAPQSAPQRYLSVLGPGRSIEDVAREVYHPAEDLRLVQATLLPGEYHPRIWRNGISKDAIDTRDAASTAPSEMTEVRQRVVALHRLQRQLADAFEVVTPLRAHAAVHGEAIGQILALAAFEIERLLRSAYIANHPSGVVGSRDLLTLDDFFALAAPMRLSEWEVRLAYYDEWGPIRPFSTWARSSAPTWWTAYNNRKHKSLGAQLADAIECVAGVRILVEAEFGPIAAELLPGAGVADLQVLARPEWLPEELYFPPCDDHVRGAFREKRLFGSRSQPARNSRRRRRQ